jgi:hypothetical protein
MGQKISPYQIVHAFLLAEEIIWGEWRDPCNIFRWDRVRLNLQGHPDYDPCLAWVSKIKMDGSLAADFFMYVDGIWGINLLW